MTRPLVSVCVPAHNQASYIAGALRSALHHDLDLEVLVQDDASTDATAAVVHALADPRVRYARNDRRLGVAATRNVLLDRARGTYVAWLDADDEHLPVMLARQVEALQADRAIGLAHGGFHVIGAGGERLADWPAPFDRDTVEPAEVAFKHLIASNEMTTSTVVVPRERHIATGGFRPQIGASSTDWDAWLRIVRAGGVAYTAAPVARYRQHAATISAATAPGGERLRCDIAVVRRALREHPAGRATAATAATAHAALAAKALDHAGDRFTRGDRLRAARAVALAARLAPDAVGPHAPRLLLATLRGDEDAAFRTNRRILAALADRLAGTRYGAKVHRAAARDPEWDATLERIAGALRRTLPGDAVVAAIAKWDPTLLRLIGRAGRNFPDRRLMPDGYPRDGAAAVAHLEQLRSEAGVTHLVVPDAYAWWLEHYAPFADHLEERYHRAPGGPDCVVFDLRDGAAAQSIRIAAG